MKTKTTLIGLFPRPEYLVQATRDYDRKRISQDKLDEIFELAERQVLHTERIYSFDTITGGYLKWQDIFRPFTEIWCNTKAGPLTRFFETNTFYRQPIFSGAPKLEGNFNDWISEYASRLILPGPYTFKQLAKSDNISIVDIASALGQCIERSRIDHIQFQEPSINHMTKDWHQIRIAYDWINDAFPDIHKTIWTYPNDICPIIEQLKNLPVSVIGFDMFQYCTDVKTSLSDVGIGLSCVDPTVTIPENLSYIQTLIDQIVDHSQPNELWIGANPQLDLLPYDSAVNKLKVLGDIKYGVV